jgi:NDP-sugar pyrophosphorylase family protein
MIFAAGKGTRLLPLTRVLPKALLPLRGKTIIEWIVLRLKEEGVKEIMINLHHLGEKISEFLGNGAKYGVEINYSWEEELLETGGGLKKVEGFFQEGTFLAVNSDIYFSFSLARSINKHQSRGADATLILRAGEDTDLYGGVSLDPQGGVLEIGKNPTQAGKIYLFTGIQILEPVIFSYLDSQKKSIIQAYRRMSSGDRKVCGEVVSGRWEDLGTVANYQRANSIP